VQVYVEFMSESQLRGLSSSIHRYGWIAARDGLSVWIEPFDPESGDKLRDWLEGQGIEYRNV
jgi:hypothetical protein